MSVPRPAIAAWPATPLPLPRYRRRRYRLTARGPTQALVGEALADSATVSGETCLRLTELDLDDADEIVAFADEVGTVGFGGGPDEESVPAFVLGATVVRDAVSAWRILTGEDEDPAGWCLPRLRDVEPRDAPAAAAEYLNDVLASGLPSFSPTVAVATETPGEEPVLDLNLHTVCCLELFNHVTAGNAFARCANETCARLFVLDETGRRRGMRYCSRACARAQAQREFRRRRARGA